jgi:hypothetical protein
LRQPDVEVALRRTEMAKALARFTIEPTEEGFALHIEDEDGDTLELTATPEQLDLLAEAIDEHLSEDIDDVDAVE